MTTSTHGNRLTIDKIDVVWGKVPVSVRFSYGSPDTFSFLLVRIHSGEHSGWGETLVPAVEECRQKAAGLIGKDAAQLDDLLELDEAAPRNLYLETLSIGLHNLVAQATGRPLHDLLGGAGRTTVPLMPCIFPTDPKDAAKRACFFANQNMQYLKVKLMGDAKMDLPTIRAIRQVVRRDIYLQGDANNGYAFDDLTGGLLADLAEAGLDVIEDPCDAGPGQYAQLRGPNHPGIMIDVMARNDAVLREILEIGGADLVNLHPCQQCTLSHAVARARMCREHNVPEVVGGTGYIGVGTVAYQHLAGAIGLSGPCGELSGSFDHGMPTVCDGLPIRAGCVDLPHTPGVAPRLRMDVLEQYVHGRRAIE